MPDKFKFVENGSITTPAGFSAAGITCGLKKSGNPDMALIVSDVPAAFSGAFTTCKFAAAPVQLCKERVLKQDKIRAVIINSGNANACTGKQGYEDAVEMCGLTAAGLGISPDEVMVSSTGRIGVHMPMNIISAGIDKATKALDSDGGLIAAKAIMTTDTVPKYAAVSVELSGGVVSIGGITKGAGMIDPNITVPHATMLAYVTTDADIDNKLLAEFLGKGAEYSFNRINIDGDMSTNDSLIIMANGVSGVKVASGSEDAEIFYQALQQLLQELAKKMVRDGEGVTKFVTVIVSGAASAADARMCAEAVCNSLLCKTAWFGCDPNWGRVIAAIGYSGADFKPENVKLDYDDMPVVRDGQDAGTPEAVLAQLLKKGEFTVSIDLGAGDCDYQMWTNDVSYEYVKINAEYHT